MAWKIYDKFSEKELNSELWEIESKFPSQNVKVEIDGKLTLIATSAKESLGIQPGPTYKERLEVWEPAYVGEAVKIISKYKKVSGIEAEFLPNFDESHGEGNVHLRGISKRFCYLIGINFKYNEREELENSDVFVHLWDKEINAYPDGGRIHLKDVFPKKSEITLGMKWDKTFYYNIGGNYFEFPSSFPTVRELIKADSLDIRKNGLESFDLKIDIYGKKPSCIKASISEVRIREIT